MADRKGQKQSKADIAKQFDLPERQSKITTLLNQAGQAYCICRSSDSSRFMIGCDACEEWYHGDCINISEKEAKYIRQYYCDKCRQEDPSLTTRFKPQKRENDDRDFGDQKKKRKEHSDKRWAGSSTGTRGCGECSGCLRTQDCGRCEGCMDMVKYGANSRLKIKCKHRTCLSSIQAVPKPVKSSSGSRSKHRSSELVSGRNENIRETSISAPMAGADGMPLPLAHLFTDSPRQCYGPMCTNAARQGSKYCSPACGIKLASNRIYQVLPQRIQEWALQPCAAEAADRKMLHKVREKLAGVYAALQELDKRRATLDEIVEKARSLAPTVMQTEEPDDEIEMSMYCITCGHEIHSRTAVKHMEKCFNKYEAQSSFGSVFKTRIEGNNMFCDFYNPINRTYCKRLRVLCPEHCKEPKVSDTDVCGCPLVKDVFVPTGEFCRAPRKSCLKHYAWEKLRRAEVDMERVRQWLKVDELMEQERNIRYAMASRAGVLGLMLHSTYNHEIMEMITSNMKAGAQPTATQIPQK